MDSREKFNIKQMIDCEKQEPFYPVTHALAVKIIDNGEIVNLQDVIGSILEFIKNYNNYDFDLLTLGYRSNLAFPGDEGALLKSQISTLIPVATSVITENTSLEIDGITTPNELETRPISSIALINYLALNTVNSINEIDEGIFKYVYSDTLYKYVQAVLLEYSGGIIGPNGNNTDKFVSGQTVYDYLTNNFTPDGVIEEGNTKPVSGDRVYWALYNIESLWESDNTFRGCIKQKPVGQDDLNLEVTKDYEVAIGKNNISTNKTILSVGIGNSNNRRNAFEVTNNVDNSVVVPYNGSYVSILSHFRNELSNNKHLSDALMAKLSILFLKITATMTLDNNILWYNSGLNGVQVTLSIKDYFGTNINEGFQSASIGICDVDGLNSVILYNDLITDGQLNISLNFSVTGGNWPITSENGNGYAHKKLFFTFLTEEMSQPETVYLDIYFIAPSYAIIKNGDSLNNDFYAENSTLIQCDSITNFEFNGSIANDEDGQYIYFIVPSFISDNINVHSFKDKDTNIELSMIVNNTIMILDLEYSVYRTNKRLDAQSVWNIIIK